MQFTPRKTKFRKQQKGKNFNKVTKLIGSITKVTFGSLGLKTLYFGRVTSKQIETLRQTLNKILKKQGKIKINLFAHTPITKKPIEIRMGKGKGNVDHWVSKTKVGDNICEIETTNRVLAIKALKIAQYKFPIKTKIFFN
jgi:large subunit ribosomal protein L16